MDKIGDFEDIEIYIDSAYGIILRYAGNGYVNYNALEVQLLNLRDISYLVLMNLGRRFPAKTDCYYWETRSSPEFPSSIIKIIELNSFRKSIPDLLVFDILEE